VFFGRVATRVGDPQDDNEADQIAWVPLSQLLDMVDDNRIRDGASLVAVLHLLASRRAT
jgi:hypothetical protein